MPSDETTGIKLGAVSVDSADPRRAGEFYRELLGLEAIFETDDFVALQGGGVILTLQRVEGLRAPDWPGDTVPKQLHLELSTRDLDAAEARALELGARKPDHQPSPDRWRVLLDLDGHPFCLSNLIPDP